MVTNTHIRRLRRLDQLGMSPGRAAATAGIDDKTARKYRRLGKLPSEVRMEHTWRTRPDPFADIWSRVEELLLVSPELQTHTLFAWLQQEYPGRFADGQLRTLQRRLKQWRALQGPAKEVFFSQVHEPGRLCASDFTHLSGLQITVGGQAFPHLIYHFVLTYSNWETGTICFTESFESLSDGLQNALAELGGVPHVHRTDSLTAAVPPGGDRQVFQHSYALFLRQLIAQRNRGRQPRLVEEVALLKPLPAQRIDACKYLDVRVDSGSTIHVAGNTYSVASRLIGEWVEVRLHADHLEVWYAQRHVERLPRLRGRGKHRVEYRHIIDWLVRKPGAFAGYCYRDDLFPSSRFRLAYDTLVSQKPERAAKEYPRIPHLAARQSESGVAAALERLARAGTPLSAAAVTEELDRGDKAMSVSEVVVAPDGSFVDRRENVLAFGSVGSGKTHLLAAAQELVRGGRKVLFTTCNLLVQDLLIAKRDLKLSRMLKRLAGFAVLMIDDLGCVQQSREEMEVLFTLLAERYERGSVLLTSNLPFSPWEQIFKDPMTTAAAIDRLVHHSVIIELNLPSYRAEQAKKAKQSRSSGEEKAKET